jgi:hypothetical protein
MRREHASLIAWARGLGLALIVAAGFASIVGSGGGIGLGYLVGICDVYPDSCAPLPPTIVIAPARATVQVGDTLAFTTQATGFADPTYQWQRSADGGKTYLDIAGATAASHTLAGANLGDDATVFHVIARPRGSGGPVTEASSRLAVSSGPGFVFQDGDFPTGGWQLSEISTPPNNGATHTEERAASGGNPDAFRRMTHAMSATQQSLGVLSLSTSAVFDPVQTGAIFVMDYSEDCALLGAGNPIYGVYSSLLIEQAGRHYRPKLLVSESCTSATWTPLRAAASLTAADFELLMGRPCAAGQACPDFSASAPPIRFGFVRFAQANTTPTVHGIDNWKVTVWPRQTRCEPIAAWHLSGRG